MNSKILDASFLDYIARRDPAITTVSPSILYTPPAVTGFLARVTSSTLTTDQWEKIKVINDDRLSGDTTLWTEFFTDNSVPVGSDTATL